MKNSHLIQLIRKLSKKERRRAQQFTQSPYFNQREDVIRLMDYLLLYIDQPGGYLKKETAYKTVFPSEIYDDSKMRYAMSFLLKVIKRYIAFAKMTTDGIQEQIYLCSALRELGQDKLFEKEWNTAKKQLEQQSLRNQQYYQANYLLYQEQYEYISQQRRSGDMRLKETTQHLFNYFLTNILKQGCLALAYKQLSNISHEISITDTLVAQLQPDLEQLPASVAIYYHSYQCLKSLDNEVNFKQLKQLIAGTTTILDKEEYRDVYLSAINYSITQINNGKRSYIKEAFELYQAGLQKEIFLDNGFLSHFLYKNILIIGLALHEKEWVANFLQEYKAVLYPKNRENFYRYCMANFYFRTQNYDKAMPLLQQVDFHDTLCNLDARRMLLCIYYELDEIEPLYSHLDSFSTFIRRRKKELGYHSENFSNLIFFVKKLLKLNLSDKAVRTVIQEEIKSKKRLAEKAWLLKQVAVSNTSSSN